MKRRFIQKAVQQALADTPVVLIRGARQTGKTTLARTISAEIPGSRYLTLDEPLVLSEAVRDPATFLEATDSLLVVDEIQKAPELLAAIKLSVDRDRRPGRFLLTGSADIMALPRVSESLAGRMEVTTLHPFSQGEIEGRMENFIDRAFGEEPESDDRREPTADDLWSRIVRGGFPEMQARATPERRDAWCGAYITTLLQREVRDIANISGLRELPRLLQLLAARTASLMNVAELSRSLGIPHSTLNRYLAILEAVFVFQPLPAWSGNMGRRLIRAPKVQLSDAGLTSQLTGLTQERLEQDTHARGPILENFACQEVRKQVAWSRTKPSIHYYRDVAGAEIDLMLEDRRGRLVAIEVKSSASPSGRDLAAVRYLQRELGDRLIAGYILYTGSERIAMTPKIRITPVQDLWA